MRNFSARVKCFISGEEIKVRRVTRTVVEGSPPVLEIETITTEELAGISPRSLVQVFYYDQHVSAWRQWFDGEITPGQTYLKRNGVPDRVLTAISPVTHMNDVPNKILETMDNSIFSSQEYKFYNMPVEKAASDVFLSTNSDKYLSVPSEYLSGDKGAKTMTGYFSRFVEMAIGKNCWTEYYKNMGKRHKISDDHVYMDNGRFTLIITAEIFLRMIRNINGEVISSRTRALDTLLSKIDKIGCCYVQICSPAFIKDGVGQKSQRPGGNEVLTYRMKESMPKYIVMPKTDNTLPPKCNVMYADKNRVLDIKIIDNVITRLMNKYTIFDQTQAALVEYYPPELEGKMTENRLLDIEKRVGMRAVVGQKDTMYEMLVANATKGAEQLADYRKFTARADYYEYAYGRNTVSLSGDGFDPYVVVGLPGIICDVVDNTYYYGVVQAKHDTIDMENGRVTFSATLRNARKIEDVRDITARRVIKDNVTKWEHHKCPGWYPSFYTEYDLEEESGRSEMTTNIYEKFLKGIGDSGEGWQTIIDGMADSGTLETEDVLGRMAEVYKSDTAYHKYKSREIATMSEFYKRLLGDTEESERYGDIEDLRDKITAKTGKEEYLDSSEWGEKVFVEERRDLVRKYVASTGSRMLGE